LPSLARSTRDAASTRDYGDALQDGHQGAHGARSSDHRGHPRRRHRRRAWPSTRLRSEVSAPPTRISRSPRPGSASFTAMPRRRRLIELIGPSRAKDLLFTARRVETDEALAIGLIDRRIETALQELCWVMRGGLRR